MSELPESVVVCGQRFEVRVIDDPDEGIARGTNHGALGATHVDKGIMRLRGGGEQSDDQLRDTMLHEVLHAVVRLTYSEKSYAKEDEEPAVGVLATHLLDTFRRNPGLVEYLMADAG